MFISIIIRLINKLDTSQSCDAIMPLEAVPLEQKITEKSATSVKSPFSYSNWIEYYNYWHNICSVPLAQCSRRVDHWRNSVVLTARSLRGG